jgi:Tn3 transposase DDE domain
VTPCTWERSAISFFPTYCSGTPHGARNQQIRAHLAFKLQEATVADGEDMSRWLVKHVLPSNHQQDTIRASCYEHFRTLHLLQICLVYINTLIIQQVLNQPKWANKLAVADYQELSPIFYQHINPYGTFRLDMKEHIIFDQSTQESS